MGQKAEVDREMRNVKRLIVFDLDGTLAPSKTAPDAEMSGLFHDLLGIVRVAVISGGDWGPVRGTVLSGLPCDERLAHLSSCPPVARSSSSTRGWTKLYSEDLTSTRRPRS